jgi:hypothetical protein
MKEDIFITLFRLAYDRTIELRKSSLLMDFKAQSSGLLIYLNYDHSHPFKTSAVYPFRKKFRGGCHMFPVFDR